MEKKIVILTGGAGFIGSHWANLLIKNNYKVVIMDSKKINKFKTYANENLNYIHIDITNEFSIKKVFNKLKNKKIHALINNAAIDSVPKKTKKNNHLPDTIQWKYELDVSLTGSYLMTKYFGEKLKRQKNGKIIYMGSDLSVVAPNQEIYKSFGNFLKPVTYSVVKHGMLGLTRYFASLYSKHNVQVNMLSPGPIYNKHSKKFVKAVSEKIPVGRMGDLKDLDSTLIYLLDVNNNFITGQNIIVDGGRTII
jgi:NAD(P)-dependent dehydrogenase (short-subunit alcohol dehydrogenase family)